jgi:hypothetical protein
VNLVARAKPPEEEPPDDLAASPPLYYALTPNQVVAYNLQRARVWRQLTQQQAAELLEPYVGKRWSKANFSAAERSVVGERIRQFDADEIVAFAKAFDLPVAWFFMPPTPWADDGAVVHLQLPASEQADALALLADLVFGDDEGQALLELRLQAFLQDLGPAPVTNAQARIAGLVNAKKTQLVEHAIKDLTGWQTALRSLANQLEDLQTRARDAAHRDLGPATDQTAATRSSEHRPTASGTGTAKPARTRKGASGK